MNTQLPVATRAAVEAFFTAYDAHNVDKMVALCSDDAQLRYVPMGKLGEGPVRIVGRRIWNTLMTALPNLTVSAQWSMADAHSAAAEVIVADERRGFRLPHAYLLRLDENDRITEVVAYWDNLTFAFQGVKALIGSIVNLATAVRSRPAP